MKEIIRRLNDGVSGDFELTGMMQKYARGMLSQEEMRDFEKRLENREDLKKELQSWKEFYGVLKDARTPEQSEEFWEIYRKSLARKLDAEPGKRRRWSPAFLWGFKPVVAAAMTVLVITAAYTVWTSREGTQNVAGNDDSYWLELCMNEFESVAQEEVIFEPLPPAGAAENK